MVQKTLRKNTFAYEVTLMLILLQQEDFLDAEKSWKGWDQQKAQAGILKKHTMPKLQIDVEKTKVSQGVLSIINYSIHQL